MKSYKIGFADMATTKLPKDKHIKLIMNSIKRNIEKAIEDGYPYISIEFKSEENNNA